MDDPLRDPLRFAAEAPEEVEEVHAARARGQAPHPPPPPPLTAPPAQPAAPAPAPPAGGHPLGPLAAPTSPRAANGAPLRAPPPADAAGPSSSDASPSHPSPPHAAPRGRLRISVSDPVKRVADHLYIPGLTTSHWEYLVASSAEPAAAADPGRVSMPPARREVRRRYSDFAALAALLEQTRRGLFAPPCPDKGVLDGAAAGRGEGEFVAARRAELERYLRRLVAHPEIGRGAELAAFLEAEGALATSARWVALQPPPGGGLLEGVARLPRQVLGLEGAGGAAPADAGRAARHTGDLLRRMRELGERTRQEAVPAVAAAALPEGEARLREARAGAEAYAEAVAAASRRAERALREFERLGDASGDLGLALVRLANYEDAGADRLGAYSPLGAAAKAAAADARRAGMAAVRHCRAARSATAAALGALAPLHDELAAAPAAAAALREREDAALTAAGAREGAARRRAALAAVEGAPSGEPAAAARRAAGLRDEILALEAAGAAADAEYERVKGRNVAELARWRVERAAGYASMSRALALAFALHEERAAAGWAALADDFRSGGGGAAEGEGEEARAARAGAGT
jgi:hypothetical protein